MSPDQPPLTLSGAWFQYIARSLAGLGVPVANICRDLEIDGRALRDPDMRVDRDAATSLWREAAARTEDPSLGLHAADHFRLALNNVTAHLLVSCANVQEALLALCRYQPLVAAGPVVSLEARGDVDAVLVAPLEGRLSIEYHQIEFIMGALAQITRSIVDSPIEFSAHFRHRCAGDPEEYRDFFGGPVTFRSTENALLLDATAMKEPVRDHSDETAHGLRLLAEENLRSQQSDSVSQSVWSALRRRIRSETGPVPRLGVVARELHMSERTLQRSLAAESTTFAGLLDEVRRGLAFEMLDAGRSHDSTANRLGYSSVAALNRALRRWKSRG